MASQKPRTRFAPSPTGYMHVGNLRTALYAYLTAKHEDGTFILRIEDTDQGRLVEGATDIIYNTLRQTGLLWDEGPDVGGPVGPYIQSERMGLFKEYAEQLVKAGKAYYCFCTPERLEAIGRWLTGAKAYYLQQFVDSGDLLGSGMRPLTTEELENLHKAVLPYIKNTSLRGI